MNTRKPSPIEPTEVVEFIVHGALAPRLVQWFNSIGMDVTDWKEQDDDGLRALMVTPCQELMDLAERSLPDGKITG